MNEKLKKIGFLVMCLGLFVGAKAFALSLEQAQLADSNKTANGDYRTYATGTLFNIFYVGAATGAVVASDGTNFLTYAPYGTADLSLAAATYTTLGALCDKINAATDYVCYLTGGKRDDLVTKIAYTAAALGTDAKVAGGYNLLIGSGTAGTGSISEFNRIGITPAKNRRVVLKWCEGKVAGAANLNIYGKLMKFDGASDMTRNDTTLVAAPVMATGTDTVWGNIYGQGNWIEFAPNEHVVISAAPAATQVQVAGDYVQCFWDEK